MNKIRALEIIHEYIQDNAKMLSFDEHTAFSIAIAELNDADHDGCSGCAFESVEEWEMPCVKCKYACKDYYRHKPSDKPNDNRREVRFTLVESSEVE